MNLFLNNLLYSFIIAFGVIIGSSFFAGLGALINNDPPLKTMMDISRTMKIWAVAVGIGGTFTSFEIIEKGLLKGEIRAVIKQFAYIVAAFTGSNCGYMIVFLLRRCGEIWMK